jgi:hypothetical protein
MSEAIVLVIIIVIAFWLLFRKPSERLMISSSDADAIYGSGASGNYAYPSTGGWNSDPTISSLATASYDPEYSLALTNGDAQISGYALANADAISPNAVNAVNAANATYSANASARRHVPDPRGKAVGLRR